MMPEKTMRIDAWRVHAFTALFVLPALFVTYVPYFLVWEHLDRSLLPRRIFGDRDPRTIVVTIVAFAVGLVVHELVHGMFWSRFTERRWKSIEFGIAWKSLMPYCTFRGALSREQFLIGTLAPLFVMGLIPSVFALLVGSDSLELFGIGSVIAAGGDVYVALAVARERRGCLVVDRSDGLGFSIRTRADDPLALP